MSSCYDRARILTHVRRLYPHTGQLSRYAWSLVFCHLATGRTQGLTQALLRQRPAESAEIVRQLAYCNSSAW